LQIGQREALEPPMQDALTWERQYWLVAQHLP
jgi:hypothetical protein